MNKWILTGACIAALIAPRVWAGTAEDWTNITTGNTGTFADTQGSKLSFSIVDGAKKGEKAVKIESDLKQGGWCGLWHNTTLNMSKANAIKFMAKADAPCQVNLSLTDANKMQYGALVSVASKDWTEITVPLSSFEVNKYYTPEGAVKGKPLDLSNVQSLAPGPSGAGASTFYIGAIAYTEGALITKADVAAEAAKSIVTKGVTVVLQDFGMDDPKIGGVWKDEKGTTISLSYKPAKKKENADDKMALLHYNLTEGGWCGMWYLAGDDPSWGGVDLAGGKMLVVRLYATKALEFGISLEDPAKLKFDGVGSANGGKWETVLIPMTGLPAAFTSVKTFNFYLKTPGEATLSIDQIAVVK